MTTDKPKPREWFIAEAPGLAPERVFKVERTARELCPDRNLIHVVEIQALREAEREIEQWKTEAHIRKCAYEEIFSDKQQQSEIITELAAALETARDQMEFCDSLEGEDIQTNRPTLQLYIYPVLAKLAKHRGER